MTSIGSSDPAPLGYPLVDADRVLTRVLVYTIMAVFVGGVFAVLVIGLGALLGDTGGSDVALSVVATAVVAVAFQPARRRTERLVNRVLFGRRATPYEILSDFTRRVAATSEGLVDDAAQALAEGTRAQRVVVSIAGQPRHSVVAFEDGDAPTDSVSFPIVDGELTLGSLDLYLPTDRWLRAEDRRLAEQLASTMGLALRNKLLTEGLEARVQELRESQRTLVSVQDETRRRLERDLHDGVQQQLVALKVKIGLGRTMAKTDGAAATAEALERMSVDADGAVEAMRDFARGVHPPLLEAEGLESAVVAEARRVPIPVIVHSDGIARYPHEVETAVYYCVNEALRNTVQHARSSRAEVDLTQTNGTLVFRVTDDGAGFDPTAVNGPGLITMAERLHALNGELAVESTPGEGTSLRGAVPVVEATAGQEEVR